MESNRRGIAFAALAALAWESIGFPARDSALATQRQPGSTKIDDEFVKRELADYKPHGRGGGPVKPGDLAPDFNVKRVAGDDRVRLSSFAGKRPVVLVFGT